MIHFILTRHNHSERVEPHILLPPEGVARPDVYQYEPAIVEGCRDSSPHAVPAAGPLSFRPTPSSCIYLTFFYA